MHVRCMYDVRRTIVHYVRATRCTVLFCVLCVCSKQEKDNALCVLGVTTIHRVRYSNYLRGMCVEW